MTNFTPPNDALHQVKCTIDKLDEITAELEAEKAVAHAKGYISALRYSRQIEHEQFKPMDEALDKALRDWHNKHKEL